MNINYTAFGEIEVNGIRYTHDIVIDGGNILKRNKKNSRSLKSHYAHTPLTAAENIPWNCCTLIIGTGMYRSLPVTDEVRKLAEQKQARLVLLKTGEAVELLQENPDETNAVLHLTC